MSGYGYGVVEVTLHVVQNQKGTWSRDDEVYAGSAVGAGAGAETVVSVGRVTAEPAARAPYPLCVCALLVLSPSSTFLLLALQIFPPPFFALS